MRTNGESMRLAVSFSRQLIGIAFAGAAGSLALWLADVTPGGFWDRLVFRSFAVSGLFGCLFVMRAIASIHQWKTDPFDWGLRFSAIAQFAFFFLAAMVFLVILLKAMEGSP